MKATLRSVRISPKKANLVAKMVRGMTVADALFSLERTNKKAARLLQTLIESAVANAEHNDKQAVDSLVIKSLIVNQAQVYHRGIPMARGRMRPIKKYLSHIELTLGVEGASEKRKEGKSEKSASQNKGDTVQKDKKSAMSTGKGSSKAASASTKKTSPSSEVSNARSTGSGQAKKSSSSK